MYVYANMNYYVCVCQYEYYVCVCQVYASINYYVCVCQMYANMNHYVCACQVYAKRNYYVCACQVCLGFSLYYTLNNSMTDRYISYYVLVIVAMNGGKLVGPTQVYAFSE